MSEAASVDKTPVFPFAAIAQHGCHDEEQAQKFLDRFVAEGGTGELLMQQLKAAYAKTPVLGVIFSDDYMPILRAIPDFSACRLPAVASAVGNRSMGALNLLIERGADLYANTNQRWGAAMVIAARHEDPVDAIAFIHQLLQAGADIDMTPESGETALMHAAARGHAGVVRLLLQEGADVSRRDNTGRTALHWALGKDARPHSGCVEAARVLIEEGRAAVDARDFGRHTPLHHLAFSAGGLNEQNSKAAIDLLLGHGADIEARNGGQQHTALLMAADNADRGWFLIDLLHRRGADLDVKVEGRLGIDTIDLPEKNRRVLCAIRMGEAIDRAMPDDADPASVSSTGLTL